MSKFMTRKQATESAAAAAASAEDNLRAAEKSHRGVSGARKALEDAEAHFRVVSDCAANPLCAGYGHMSFTDGAELRDGKWFFQNGTWARA